MRFTLCKLRRPIIREKLAKVERVSARLFCAHTCQQLAYAGYALQRFAQRLTLRRAWVRAEQRHWQISGKLQVIFEYVEVAA